MYSSLATVYISCDDQANSLDQDNEVGMYPQLCILAA